MRTVWMTGWLIAWGMFLLPAEIPAQEPPKNKEKMVITIGSPTEKKINVAIPAFHVGQGVDAELGKNAAALLAKDLNLSGVFKTVDARLNLKGQVLTPADYQALREAGADYVVVGTLRKSGGEITVTLAYHDTVQAKTLQLPGGATGKVYNVSGTVHPAVHAFANTLMELITQRPGPFGTRIAFEYKKNPTSNRKDLYVIDLDGTNLTPLTKNNLLNLSPAWSADGTYIAYTSYKRRNPDLYLMNLKTGSDEPISTRANGNLSPAFSPDGRMLAASLAFEDDGDIYLLDLSGKILSRLTNSPAIDSQPTFSPDGKRMAFMSDRLGNPNIFIMNTDGTGVTRLTTEGKYNASPAWSPAGDWIAFYRRDDGAIWIVRPDGSETRQLTSEGMNEDPSWSPDGRYIVFSSNRMGTYDLWVVDSVTSTQTRITDFPGDERNPSWGPYTFR